MACKGLCGKFSHLKQREHDKERDPEPLNMASEVALLRALATDYVNRYDKKPTQILDLAEAARIVTLITQAVERIEKVRAANVVSRADLYRVMQAMGAVVAAE